MASLSDSLLAVVPRALWSSDSASLVNSAKDSINASSPTASSPPSTSSPSYPWSHYHSRTILLSVVAGSLALAAAAGAYYYIALSPPRSKSKKQRTRNENALATSFAPGPEGDPAAHARASSSSGLRISIVEPGRRNSVGAMSPRRHPFTFPYADELDALSSESDSDSESPSRSSSHPRIPRLLPLTNEVLSRILAVSARSKNLVASHLASAPLPPFDSQIAHVKFVARRHKHLYHPLLVEGPPGVGLDMALHAWTADEADTRPALYIPLRRLLVGVAQGITSPSRAGAQVGADLAVTPAEGDLPPFFALDPYDPSFVPLSHRRSNFRVLIAQALGWIEPTPPPSQQAKALGLGVSLTLPDQEHPGSPTATTVSDPPTPLATSSFSFPSFGAVPNQTSAAPAAPAAQIADLSMSQEWTGEEPTDQAERPRPLSWGLFDDVGNPGSRTPTMGAVAMGMSGLSGTSGYEMVPGPHDGGFGFPAEGFGFSDGPTASGASTPKAKLPGFEMGEGFLGWSEPGDHAGGAAGLGDAWGGADGEDGSEGVAVEVEDELDGVEVEVDEKANAEPVVVVGTITPVEAHADAAAIPASTPPTRQSFMARALATVGVSRRATTPSPVPSRTPSPPPTPTPWRVPVPSSTSPDPPWIQHVTLALAVLAAKHARPVLVVVDGAEVLFEQRGRRVEPRDGVWDDVSEVLEWLGSVERRGWAEVVLGGVGGGGVLGKGLRGLRVFDRRLHVRTVDYDTDEAISAYLLDSVNPKIEDEAGRFDARTAALWVEYFGGNGDEVALYVAQNKGVEEYIQARTVQTLAHVTEFLSDHPFFASTNPHNPSYLPDLTALVLHLIVNNGAIDPSTENWGTRMWELVDVLVSWRLLRRRAKFDDRGSTASTRSSLKSGSWWARGKAPSASTGSGVQTNLRGKQSALGPSLAPGAAGGDPFKPLPPHLFDAWNPTGAGFDEQSFLSGVPNLGSSPGSGAFGGPSGQGQVDEDGGNLSDGDERHSSEDEEAQDEDEDDSDDDVDWGEVELVWYDALVKDCMERWFNTVGISGTTYNPFAADRLLTP
ncbi:hypothetical protein M427DRAFT_131398 [Gonapodya prolifera JEL478]|uniref:Uncharacterized protein n=1 Tax=Gonapodya prolifera (strain JEL478) TaxID=1344416 RepID=A0A139AVB2_GONPJ|nr:hypothetical protein M427DRAFT_131398 [Gonapodya prolifera JEL478]|eukprot:KXS20639.1 hypothetical protein M427DRAFT_131398 [Gonapodya prolifera JEL478]